MEELLIKKVEADIRGLRMRTKTPEQIKVMYFLNKLKEINEELYSDYLEKYLRVEKNNNK
tara:strand:- start:115 stop:294 length:180 start_codon:yes stop_codon:yes gene_type:complete